MLFYKIISTKKSKSKLATALPNSDFENKKRRLWDSGLGLINQMAKESNFSIAHQYGKEAIEFFLKIIKDLKAEHDGL